LSDNQVVSQATGTSPLGCTQVSFSRRPETSTTETKSDCDRPNRNILEVRSGQGKGKTKQKEDPDKELDSTSHISCEKERKKEDPQTS
jgi:hypothetical protein